MGRIVTDPNLYITLRQPACRLSVCLTEVDLEGGGEAVGPPAQIDLVDIELEDLVLAEAVLDFDSAALDSIRNARPGSSSFYGSRERKRLARISS